MLCRQSVPCARNATNGMETAAMGVLVRTKLDKTFFLQSEAVLRRKSLSEWRSSFGDRRHSLDFDQWHEPG